MNKFKKQCPRCGKVSYGWGEKCRYCNALMDKIPTIIDTKGLTKIDILYEGRDYEGGNE